MTWSWANFTPQEMACSRLCDCDGGEMNPGFMDRLQRVRSLYGLPMHVTSGYRCASYNQKVSDTGPNGPHTTGHAVDIAVYGGDWVKLLVIAYHEGMTRFGVKQHGDFEGRFLHMDDLPANPKRRSPWGWTYA